MWPAGRPPGILIGNKRGQSGLWSYGIFGDLPIVLFLIPIHHGDTADRIAVYKVEPYVVAADACALAPHTGRVGWTWYTGAAGWMYRLLIETLLGLNLEGDQLRLSPCLPACGMVIKSTTAIGARLKKSP